MLKVYAKIAVTLRDKIANYELKAEDPGKLAVKIKRTEAELIDIENRMNEKVDDIIAKYAGSGKRGLIAQRAEEVMSEYKRKIENIKGTGDSSLKNWRSYPFARLTLLSILRQIYKKKVIAECNEALRVALSGNNTVEYVSLEPGFFKRAG